MTVNQWSAEVKGLVHELSEADLARLGTRVADNYGFARMSVGRWLQGISAPHNSLFAQSLKAIREAKVELGL